MWGRDIVKKTELGIWDNGVTDVDIAESWLRDNGFIAVG